MQKEILFGKESRAKLLAGVQKITNAVKTTMGASGKCVLIGNAVYGNDGMIHLPTIVTKDGWTVTKHFELADPIENRGAMMIKEAATKTVEVVGDATTCTCVLAESMITGGIKLVEEKSNSQQLKKGMDKALEDVLKQLKKISTPVRNNIDRVRQIATVSANNDKTIGDLIADAISKIGYDGVIDVEGSNGIETEIKLSDGYKIDKGWVSPLFINNYAKETCEFDNALILLYDKKINHHTQINRALEISNQQGKPLLIICEDAEDEGLAFLSINNHRKVFRCCVIKSSGVGDARREGMEDIALITKGTYVSDIRGVDIKEVEFDNLGQAKKIIVSKNETVIIGGMKDKKVFKDFVNDLKMNLTQAKTEEDKFPIEKRIARLTENVALLKVGAATETELNEKLDRVDDAVRATKAAISDGFVAGGGVAFLRINGFNDKHELNDFEKGENLVYTALKSPFIQICDNAGINSEAALVDVLKEKGDVGYNILTSKIEDMVKAGIIDSVKALINALINAVSVAGMVITSECSITTIH